VLSNLSRGRAGLGDLKRLGVWACFGIKSVILARIRSPEYFWKTLSSRPSGHEGPISDCATIYIVTTHPKERSVEFYIDLPYPKPLSLVKTKL
jgi:hypothetical protein